MNIYTDKSMLDIINQNINIKVQNMKIQKKKNDKYIITIKLFKGITILHISIKFQCIVFSFLCFNNIK